jgi:hypothetical protein
VLEKQQTPLNVPLGHRRKVSQLSLRLEFGHFKGYV